MTRRTIVTSLIVLLLLAITASAALAAPPKSVHIEVLEFIGTSGEPFTASGDAVTAGMLCASGTVADITVTQYGPPVGDFRFLNVLKRFTCGDGSGTFDLELKVRLNLITGETTAHWKFVSGTGPYAGLKAKGTLIGTPKVQGTSIFDVYDGKVH